MKPRTTEKMLVRTIGRAGLAPQGASWKPFRMAQIDISSGRWS